MSMRNMTFREAIREALAEEMRRDENVIMLGEDIGIYGGGFRVTEGLIGEFGNGRILETPISETAFTGVATGAAITGMRPIVEYMFSDFMAVCWDQIMNEAAKIHYIYNGQYSVPMVIRSASGAGTGAAAQHSQSLEAMYCHVPGLKVAYPSTPYDAKGLLKAAVRDNDPVIFLEDKLLYDTEGSVPEGEYTIKLGEADLKKDGGDIVLISYGRMVLSCMEAAGELSKKGIDAAVLDLRSLLPLDRNSIIDIVKKTGRALIVHEAVKFAGFGAEILSTIMESDAFYKLKAPVKRLGSAFCPVPSAKKLEDSMIPDAADILGEALAMINT